jgi:hypothetical protein
MRTAVSRTVRLSVATAALCAAGALFGAPLAAAATCPHGQMPLDGTCIPTSSPNDVTTDIASTIPTDVSEPSDPVPSLDQPDLFPPPFQLTEADVAAPGFNGDGGDHGH